MFEHTATVEEYVEVDLMDLEAILEKIDAFMKAAGRDEATD